MFFVGKGDDKSVLDFFEGNDLRSARKCRVSVQAVGDRLGLRHSHERNWYVLLDIDFKRVVAICNVDIQTAYIVEEKLMQCATYYAIFHLEKDE